MERDEGRGCQGCPEAGSEAEGGEKVGTRAPCANDGEGAGYRSGGGDGDGIAEKRGQTGTASRHDGCPAIPGGQAEERERLPAWTGSCSGTSDRSMRDGRTREELCCARQKEQGGQVGRRCC